MSYAACSAISVFVRGARALGLRLAAACCCGQLACSAAGSSSEAAQGQVAGDVALGAAVPQSTPSAQPQAATTQAPRAGRPAAGVAGTAANAAVGGAGAGAGAGGANAVPPGDAAADAWPMMGYDASNRYWNPAEKRLSVDNAARLREQWRVSGVGMPTGSPVIAEGKVFALTSSGTYALDLETGKQLWLRSDLTGTSSVAYDSGFVYVHHYTPPTVYKLSAADGSTVWGPVDTWDAAGSSGTSSPILAGGKVIVGHESGGVEFVDSSLMNKSRGGVDAIDTQTGMKAWAYYTLPDDPTSGENGACVWSSVSIDVPGGLVLMTTGNNYTVLGPGSDAFHAVDLATGARRWKQQVRAGDLSQLATGRDEQDTDFGANPILAEIAGRRVVAAGDKAGAFWLLDRETGEILWRRDSLAPAHSWVAGGILMNGAFDGEAFYVVSNDSASNGAVLHRLDPQRQGESTWTYKFPYTSWGAPSLANGVLVVPDGSALYVFEARSGRLLTQFDTGGTIAGGAAAIAQGKVVVKSGFLNLLDSTTRLNDQIICYGLDEPPATSGSAGMGGGGAGGAPSTDASFSGVFRTVIAANGCNSGQCHSGVAAGGLSLQSERDAYQNLVGVGAMGTACGASGLTRVVPFDPDHSLLVQKLEHTQACGTAMPSASVRLPSEQLEQVRRWVAAGAK